MSTLYLDAVMACVQLNHRVCHVLGSIVTGAVTVAVTASHATRTIIVTKKEYYIYGY